MLAHRGIGVDGGRGQRAARAVGGRRDLTFGVCHGPGLAAQAPAPVSSHSRRGEQRWDGSRGNEEQWEAMGSRPQSWMGAVTMAAAAKRWVEHGYSPYEIAAIVCLEARRGHSS